MRYEKIMADVALGILFAIVLWDVGVWFGWIRGITITDEIRSSWRSWLFFILAGTIAGGHFLHGK